MIKQFARVSKAGAWIGLAALAAAGCSHGQKKSSEVRLSALEGKRVALIETQGEPTARKVVEVALINQLIQRGTFILVSKQDVEAARQDYRQDPTDWRGIARRAGADFGLVAHVLKFDADTREGYSSEIVEDSEMEAELGPAGKKTERLYKVKSLEGTVQVRLSFAEAAGDSNSALQSGIAEATKKVLAEGSRGGIHLPPKLRFMEEVANEAFRKFFETY